MYFDRELTGKEMQLLYEGRCLYCERKVPDNWRTKRDRCIWCDDKYHQEKKNG